MRSLVLLVRRYDVILELLKIVYFDDSVGSDQVKHKPAPDGINVLLERWWT